MKNRLSNLGGEDLSISFVEERVTKRQKCFPESFVTTIEVLALDRRGLVREISNALDSLGVNVEEIATRCIPSPMSGERIFEARATILIPGHLSERDVPGGDHPG